MYLDRFFLPVKGISYHKETTKNEFAPSEHYANNIAETITLLDSLGFVIHPENSILIPTQEITFLGFISNPANMTAERP